MLRYMISKLISNFIKNIVIFIFGTLLIISTISNVSYDNIYFVVIICLIIYILILMIPEIVFYVQNKSYKFDYNYYRELPRDYSPSMVSYLLNMKIELKKDILADLIYLEERKIVECIDGNYKVIDNSVTWKESESHLKCLVEDIIPVADNLEKLLSLIKNRKKGGIFYQIISNYKKAIKNDLEKIDLICKYDLFGKSLLLLFLVCFISFFVAMAGFINVFIVCFACIWIFGFNVIGKNYSRTKKGKEDVALWLSYYRFIKDFSIMDERNLEEKKLWGYYFAYGLALGINAKVIRKFRLGNEEYIIK